MKGKDLIIYILENGLENEPVYKDGSFIGFLSVDAAAVKIGAGQFTVHALASMGKLDYIVIGTQMLIVDNDKLKNGGLNE